MSAASVALVPIGLSSCGSGGGAKQSLRADESEYQITVDRTTVPAGAVRVTAHDRGTSAHELVAFRTDLPDGALPTDSSGAVDEHGPGVTHLDPEAEAISPGGSKAITLHLQPGRYVLLCNLADHYRRGMHVAVVAQ